MPGKLAAARASREATSALLLPRPARAQGGLPTDLDDASVADTSTTFARASAGPQRAGTTDPSVHSVTFPVTPGHHSGGHHSTPTASTAGLALAHASSNNSTHGQPKQHSVSVAGLPPPRGPRGTGSSPGAQPAAAEALGARQQAAAGALQPQPGRGSGASGGGSAGPTSADSGGGGANAAGGVAGAGPARAGGPGPAAALAPAAAAPHTAGAPWSAGRQPERPQPSATPADAIPQRHSRLRDLMAAAPAPAAEEAAAGAGPGSAKAAPPGGPQPPVLDVRAVAAEAGPSGGAGGGGAGGAMLPSPREVRAGLAPSRTASGAMLLDATPSPEGRASTGGAWTAAAAPPEGSSAGTTPRGGAVGAFGPRALGRPQRPGGGGAVSALFAERAGSGVAGVALTQAEEGASAASSFTVRQTPSDLEDEAAERERARLATRAGPAAAAGGGGAGAAAAGQGARAGSRDKAGSGPGAAPPPPPAAESAARPPIRLIHQPGHQRRPPNRHASMPVMKREAGAGGAGAAAGNGAHHPYAAGGAAAVPPPLSGPLETEEAYLLDSPTVTATASGPLGQLGGGYGASAYPRPPGYDSPLTSQLSLDSGPASTALQRHAALPAPHGPGTGPGPGGATIGSHPLPNAPHSSSRLGGGDRAGSGVAAPAGGGLAAHLHHAQAAAGSGGAGGGMYSSTGAVPGLRRALALVDEEEAEARSAPAVGAAAAAALLTGSHASGGGPGGAALERHTPSHCSSRLLASGAHAQHGSNLAVLHKAVERLMLQDSGLYSRVQASMKGISSLAKETNKLEFVRDASGATVINQYVVVKTLGRGAFGKVKLCLNTLDGQLYAVKMINRAHLLRQLQKPARPLRRRAPPPRNTSETGLMASHLARVQTEGNLSISHTNAFSSAAQAAMPARASMDDTSPLAAIMREIAVMKKVDHPHVVRLHEVIDPPGSSYLMMVMEYCEGGCVMETRQQTGLAPLGEDTAREYFRQACMGLDYLHYNNVVHGDLKPENMLVSGSGGLKIADFGSSRFMGGDPMDATKTSCTPAFQSPEEISHLPVDAFAADLWALACCLFCFVFGRLPFVGSCVVDIYRAILTRPHAYPPAISASAELHDLLDRMLSKDPAKRLKLRDVAQHTWVTAGGTLPPLPSLATLAAAGGGEHSVPRIIHVTHAEAVNAIDRSSLVSLVRARLKEKTCQPGEYLFKEGEEAHCVYMIMGGVVELTQHLRRPPHHAHHNGAQHAHAAGAGAGAGPGGAAASTLASGASAGGAGDSSGALAGGALEHDGSFSVDLDESLTLDAAGEGGGLTDCMNIVDGKLHIDRQQAIEMRRRMQGSLLGENAEYVVEVKGPGSVIGEMGLGLGDSTTNPTHRVNARARGPVTVVKLTEENFFKALLQMYGGAGAGGGGSVTLTASSVSEALGRPGGVPSMSAQQLMVVQLLEDSGSYACFPIAPVSMGGRGASMDAGAGPGAGPHSMGPHSQGGLGGLGAGAVAAQQAGASGAAGPAVHGGAGGVGGGSEAGAASQPPPHSTHSHHQHRARHSGAASIGAAAAGGFAASASAAAPAVLGAAGLASSRAQPACKPGYHPHHPGASDGVHSLLGGVLNTIHSLNASRAGGHTSDEGIADL